MNNILETLYKFGKTFFLSIFIYLTVFFSLSLFTGLEKTKILCIFVFSLFIASFVIFKKQFYKFIFLYILLFLSGIFIFHNIYDISFDGNTYHLEIIKSILNGVNIYDFDFKWSNFWISFYPKTIEIIMTAFASFGNIYFSNILKLFIIFITCSNFLYLLKKLNIKLNIFNTLLIILIVLNPVVIYQFFTLYIDDLLYLFLLNMMIYVFLGEYIWGLLVVGLSVGSKITYLAFDVVLISCTIFLRLKYLNIGFKNFYLDIKNNFKTSYFIQLFIIGILVFFNQYIINTIQYKNPFYGFVGSYAKTFGQSMADDKPEILKTGNLYDLFYTYASYSNIDCKKISNCIKVFNFLSFDGLKDFILSYKITYVYDLQTAGFGNIYSIVLFFSYIFIVFYIIISIKNKKIGFEFYLITSLFVAINLLVFIMPVKWARYIPFFYILGFAFVFIFKNKVLKYIILFIILINFLLITSVNIYFYTTKNIYQIKQNEIIKSQIKDIKTIYFNSKIYNSFQYLYFYDTFGIKEKVDIPLENMLSFCGIKDTKELDNSKYNILKCPNSGLILKSNIKSFIGDYIYIDTDKNKFLKEFLEKVPNIKIDKEKININGKIIYVGENFVSFDEAQKDCKNGKVINKNALNKIINDLGNNRKILFDLFKDRGYINDLGIYIKTDKIYFWIDGSFDENRGNSAIFDKNIFDIYFDKPKILKMKALCEI